MRERERELVCQKANGFTYKINYNHKNHNNDSCIPAHGKGIKKGMDILEGEIL